MKTRSAADTLRLIVSNMDNTTESVNDRHSLPELINVYLAHIECGCDFYPDQWSLEQLEGAALRGEIPEWDENGRPIPSTRTLGRCSGCWTIGNKTDRDCPIHGD